MTSAAGKRVSGGAGTRRASAIDISEGGVSRDRLLLVRTVMSCR